MFLSSVKEIFTLRKKIVERLKFIFPEVSVVTSEGLIGGGKQTISVISTCLNEEENIESWLYSILGQSLSPSEVVICDGGSSDNTLNLIAKWKHEHPKLKVVLVSLSRANIARGRNEAVRASSGQILLFSDVGSIPDKEWVRELALPFMSDPKAMVSLGRSESKGESQLSKALSRLIIQEESEIDSKRYLASGRSIGVSREAFDRVAGFPEELTFAGEDTLFNLRLRETVNTGFYYSPRAVACWVAPEGFCRLWKMMFLYAKGDAEAGVFYKEYLGRISELTALVLGLFLGNYSFYYAISRNQYGVISIAVVALYFALSPLRSYKPKLKKFSWYVQLLAPLILVSAQSSGFMAGQKQKIGTTQH